MENFEKVVRLGTLSTYSGRYVSVFCKIEFKDDVLSIYGVVAPTSSGNAMSCGQITDEIMYVEHYAKGWNKSIVSKFADIWKKYHLNDCHSGTIEQENFLEKSYADCDYETRVDALKKANLYTVKYNGKDYTYGNSYLFRPVPEDVLEFLVSLPVADREPAWI